MHLLESETVEFKRELVNDIKKEIVAFANTVGGTLYIGIEDDGTVTGVARPNEVLLSITSSLRDAIRPDITMFTRATIEMIEGKQVVVITASTGTRRPYYLSDKGLRPAGVYVRQGSSSVPASEDAIRAMIAQTDGDAFENNRALNQELTFYHFHQSMEAQGLAYGDSQQKTLGMTDIDGIYTNLGLLLSDQCPYTIKLAVFQGINKLEFKDRKEFAGSLFAQLSASYNAIDVHNATKASFTGLMRTDERAYPLDAIREALLNALVHRDYSFSGSISINIYDNRIEFISLGGLVPGFSLAAALLGASQPRNEKLAALFYRLHLIEAYGTGLSKIMNSYAGQTVQPTFENAQGAFRVVLPNRQYKSTFSETPIGKPSTVALGSSEEKALLFLTSHPFMSRIDVESHLQVGTSRALAVLSNLVRLGLIQKTGNGKHTRYILPQNL